MPNKRLFYRYRPLDIGFSENCKSIIQEITNQEIFMGTLEENNDPMDGTQEAHWDGDEIIWKNFVKHYCLCLFDSLILLYIAGDTIEFNASHVRTRIVSDDLPDSKISETFEVFVTSIESDPKVKSLTNIFIKQKKLHRDELLFLLSFFNPYFLNLANKAINKKMAIKILPFIEDMVSQQKEINFAELMDQTKKQDLHTIADIGNKFREQIFLISKLNLPPETRSIPLDNVGNLLSLFPRYYLESSIRDIYDEHYISCFSKDNDNQSMWGHYSQGHSGVCLVFEFEKYDGNYFLELENGQKISLYKVKYSNDPPEINFFENIGYLPMPKLEEHWLTNGSESSSFAKNYRDGFHQNFWDKYNDKIVHKFRDWRYEKEYRLVKNSWFIGPQTKEQRLLQYKLKHLKGIIFGFRTPIETEMKIIRAVDELLDDDQKKEFKFSRARYSSISKKLEIYELSLLKLANTNETV